MICTIGGAFDFYAGTIHRSPEIWIKYGLEWLYRLLQNPRKMYKRSLISSPLFVLDVFKKKISTSFKLKSIYSAVNIVRLSKLNSYPESIEQSKQLYEWVIPKKL
jgi:N-acetylglucosaminyldiphosphoundecaprenol N-acetyl-beta-D-mannosaminyltransferase